MLRDTKTLSVWISSEIVDRLRKHIIYKYGSYRHEYLCTEVENAIKYYIDSIRTLLEIEGPVTLKKYTCRHCGATFTTRWELGTHVRNTHVRRKSV